LGPSDVTKLAETAYAKINLALHVRRRRADGYHALETLFAFAEEGDKLTVSAADTLSLTIAGRFANGLTSGPDNLVLRAAAAVQSSFGIKAGAALHLDKRLPIAAGIGGGSADASAAIRLLIRHWGIEAEADQLHVLAAALGADVPACLLSQTCFGSGVGDELAVVASAGLAGRPILMVNPLVPCPTGPVFSAWDGVDRGALNARDWMTGRNDLQKPAVLLVPIIADVLTALADSRAILTRMSGSGATCFALFEDENARDESAISIGGTHQSWWLSSTVLRD
jgi:4-diphosphocytidyl-2-C-methyl-D-erythritol kinase